ncbi:MAG: hypothetical protein AAF086_09255 [Planctomycetota bacterium]
MTEEKPPPPRVFEAVSRRGYWIGIGSIMAVLIAVSIWAGFYAVKVAEENMDARVSTGDPLTEILYSPIGNAVVLLVLQYAAANFFFWPAAWVGLRLKR